MSQRRQRVLVTGANGFIGKNLTLRLRELGCFEIIPFTREEPWTQLDKVIDDVDSVIHLAGENRPPSIEAFNTTNVEFTEALCTAIAASKMRGGKTSRVVFTSSSQAELDNPYGASKKKAEHALELLAGQTQVNVDIYRLPGVFGKWCRPDYNSVVATFCHNLARDIPIRVDNPTSILRLAYIDDVVESLVGALSTERRGVTRPAITPIHEILLGDLAATIKGFKSCRDTSSLIVPRVGQGLIRALYSTYVSFLPIERFSYQIPSYSDSRGVFVEMIKTIDSGQLSFFTARPNITRGGHYHHTKTEKFLVVKGTALFRFRNLLNDNIVEIQTSGEIPTIVDTIPGWAHDITNVGSDEMIVMLWANENFDRSKPDTIPSSVAI
jgi:UDP-2-acetamido-2,6-beta-L-arabino-hexul-4-ose reductase